MSEQTSNTSFMLHNTSAMVVALFFCAGLSGIVPAAALVSTSSQRSIAHKSGARIRPDGATPRGGHCCWGRHVSCAASTTSTAPSRARPDLAERGRQLAVMERDCSTDRSNNSSCSGGDHASHRRIRAATRKASVMPASAPTAAIAAPNRRRGRIGTGLRADASESRSRALEKLQDDLKRFAGLRMWRQALTAFEKAKADGVPLTSAAYTHAINAMSKGGRWKEAIALLEEMIAGGNGAAPPGFDRPRVSPSVVSYNAAISACARGRKPDLALNLLHDMRRTSGLSPDLYSYAAAMTGLAKAGKPTRALGLLDEMQETGITPDFVCFAAAMEACEMRGAWKEAEKILEQVRMAEPPASTPILTGILTSAIGACVADGAWQEAMEHLADIRMANAGALPPAAAYAAAANACARAGQAIRAQALISELAAGSGERPTIECYNAVAAACAIAGDLDGAIRTIMETVPKAGLKADTRSYNHLIAGCARAGKWETALELLNEQRTGKVPSAPTNRESFNAALDACGRAGQVKPALEVLDTMRSLSYSNRRLKPDRYSYGGALQACRHAADHATALRLLETMEAEGLRPDQACSLATVAACAAARRGTEAAKVLERMVATKTGTSERARELAREACAEAGAGFERALAALDMLREAAAERAVLKSAVKN